MGGVRALIYRKFRFFDASIVFSDPKCGILDDESTQFRKSVKTGQPTVHSVVGGSCVAAVADLRCALLCRSLVKACRNLTMLHIYIDIDATEAVLLRDRLAAQLGSKGYIRLFLAGKWRPF